MFFLTILCTLYTILITIHKIFVILLISMQMQYSPTVNSSQYPDKLYGIPTVPAPDVAIVTELRGISTIGRSLV